MSLADKLSDARPRLPSRPCGVYMLLPRLTAKDRKALEDALAVPKGDPNRLSSQQISDLLKTEGHHVSMKILEVHRKGGCSCDSRG